MDYEKLHKDTINRLQQMVDDGKITVEIARCICADFIPESSDERIRKALISRFAEYGELNGIPYGDIRIWLENQKPTEWSEDDKYKLSILEVLCNHQINDSVFGSTAYWQIYELKDWLKNLKAPSKPQNHWKPTKEQMCNLKAAYESYDFCDGERDALEALYNDLKKL